MGVKLAADVGGSHPSAYGSFEDNLVDYYFHVLRKSDPPYVPSAIIIKQGCSSFVYSTMLINEMKDVEDAWAIKCFENMKC
ncbi:E3 ubiquitin-protein ligase RKP-like isoform X2 [Silene latifolia]